MRRGRLGGWGGGLLNGDNGSEEDMGSARGIRVEGEVKRRVLSGGHTSEEAMCSTLQLLISGH